MADEMELFYTSVSKQPVIAGALVSVSDLHRRLSSFVFRVKQITQNPVVAIPCGFDPRHRHHIEWRACPCYKWVGVLFFMLCNLSQSNTAEWWCSARELHPQSAIHNDTQAIAGADDC